MRRWRRICCTRRPGYPLAPASWSRRTRTGCFTVMTGGDYYLLYQPDLQWLRSNAAMFNEHQAQRIYRAGRPAIVFAAGKFIGQRTLTDWRITFCQIPYEMHLPV